MSADIVLKQSAPSLARLSVLRLRSTWSRSYMTKKLSIPRGKISDIWKFRSYAPGKSSSTSPTRTYAIATSHRLLLDHRDSKSIVLPLLDGENLKLSYFYLRDHCTCPECRHPDTQQRLVDTFSIPESIKARAISQTEDGISIIWTNDGHRSSFTWDWLEARNETSSFTTELSLWDARIATKPPTIDHAAIMRSDDGVKQWTSLIRKWGFCFIDGCPASGKATQELIERIAFIRQTHYGGFWRFTADLSSKDSAYTSLALGAHTDTTYFSDPAGLQTFHLLSHTDGSGGSSLLIDGFKAASTLRLESPEAYHTLCRVKIRGHASGNSNVKFLTEAAYPILETESGGAMVRKVRWNNDDRAAMLARDPDEVASWYTAARKWVEILRRPESGYWEQLRPGRPLIFDNWRVLHGRSAFSGRREMCGGYTNMDDFISRWKTLNFSQKEIQNSV